MYKQDMYYVRSTVAPIAPKGRRCLFALRTGLPAHSRQGSECGGGHITVRTVGRSTEVPSDSRCRLLKVVGSTIGLRLRRSITDRCGSPNHRSDEQPSRLTQSDPARCPPDYFTFADSPYEQPT